MATEFTSNTLSGIYSDDFNEDNNFHQVLFNNGRALQARELTQLQTIIFQELARFGKNVFKEGAAVNTGGMAVDASIDYIKVSAVNAGGAFTDIPIGTIFKDTNTGVEAKVIDLKPRNVDEGFVLDTLYVQYVNSGAGANEKFDDGVVLFDQSGGGYQITTETPNATGKGVRFTLGEGDFFVLGHFVHTTEQSIILSPYTASATTTVGFKVVQEVVTVNDDTSLFDNANGIVNTASPGADRLRINLQLTELSKVTANDTFVFVANIENSKIVEQVKEIDAYNTINDLIAQRTFEESGNYIVDPFRVSVDERTFSARDSNFDVIVSPGMAYVNGYRVERATATRLSVPKPLVTETVDNDVIPISYGNYFLADSNRGLPDLDHAQVNLYDDFQAGGSSLGTARIRAVEEDGANYRVYVYDVRVDSASSLRSIKSIGSGSSDVFNITQGTQGATLNGTVDNNNLLFPLSRPRPESFSDITITIQQHQSGLVANGSGEITLATLPTGSSYTDTTLWVVSTSSASAEAHTVGTPTNSGRDVTISGLTPSSTYEVLCYVQKTATRKSKTLTTVNNGKLTVAYDSAARQYYYEFPYVDVNEVREVNVNNINGRDMTGDVRLDCGVRDNYYAKSRLILNSDYDSVPTTLNVYYDYYARGAGGDFFDATSYPESLVLGNNFGGTLDQIQQDGTVINPKNYLDFRPDEGSPFSTFDLPRNGSSVTATVSYWLPRADKILLTQEGEVQVLMGQPAGNPQYKPTPDNTLELAKVLVNGNMHGFDDCRITPIEHRRYTMADIAKLEAKIDDLQEYTELSLLELEQKLFAALDSAGNARTECGNLCDDNNDQTGADTNNPDYSASLDPESKLIRPMFDENNIRLVVDNTQSSGIVKKGDNVYLTHDSEAWAVQDLASTSVKINPFGLVDNVGTLKLSPTSDEWKDPARADRAVPGQGRLDRRQAYLWNNWVWNWAGRSAEDLEQWNPYYERETSIIGIRRRRLVELRERYFSGRSSFTRFGGRFVSRVVPSETLRQAVGNRIIDVALIPWLRSRKIFFHAKGLKPNTKHYAFFDGDNMASFVREEPAFLRWSDRTDQTDPQDPYWQTEHPDGSTDLISDANGEIIGSLWIPNTARRWNTRATDRETQANSPNICFKTGIREFKLLDTSRNDWGNADSKCFAYYAAVGAIWHHWHNMITSRPWGYWWPLSYWVHWAQIYSPKELRDTLDQIRSSAVNLVDPRFSGLYGPATAALSGAALTGLDANGQMSQILSDYIDVDQNQFAGTETNVLTAPQNPMAQTFFVDNQFGVTLTSLQLYFRAKDAGNLPVQIHLRPVISGKPAHNEIVPDSQVVLKASDVQVVGTDPVLSVIQARPTTFTFDEPVYLKPWTSYAIVVTSQSTEYELFSSKTLLPVFGSTSRITSTQNAPGSLYLPQNGLSWIEAKDQDLMYKLNRAKFDLGGGSLILKNVPLPPKLIGEVDPTKEANKPNIQTFAGSRKIYIHHANHGLEPGDLCRLDSVATSGIGPGGFADRIDGSGVFTSSSDIISYIEGAHTVDSADVNGYSFTYDAAHPVETSSGLGSSHWTLSRRNAIFNTAMPTVETVVPNFTSIDAGAKWTEGKMLSSTRITKAQRWTQDADYSRITLMQNIDFDTPKAIYNLAAEEANLGAGVASVYVKLDMKTANDYVSPIVDMQRASITLAGFKLDDPSVTPAILPVDETSPTSGTTGSKHITTPVFLDLDAVGIEVRGLVNIPNDADIQMYFRTAGGDENINDKYWIYQEPVDNIPFDNSQVYRDAQWLPGGLGGDLKPFQQAQFKFVFIGGDRAPSIKNLRYRYLAV